MSQAPSPMKDRRGRVYTPAVGPRLRPWLWVVLGSFAALAANGSYLASVTFVTWLTGVTQQTYFFFLMFGLHLALGFILMLPFIGFGLTHLFTSWKRPNKTAIRHGLILLSISFAILISGLVLVRGLGLYEVRDPRVRDASYWLHVATPLLAVVFYVRHRLAGPRIKWEWARRIGAFVGLFILAMGAFHFMEPRKFGVKGSIEGAKYFFPSEAVTSDGKFIEAETLMMDDYCLKCHKDAYDGWFHSAHHFSSFNNKAYLFSVRETRKVALERDGNTRAARWCAGCHDPVPFFSGRFDDPKYDDVNDPTSQAGITCTACHAITNVNSTRGNADYTIESPEHYPFATSKNPALQWINNALVKAKPEMHKRTFLKPLIKDAKFCSTCHKVGLPYALNHYKDFLRGQNHYDTFLLSGVSGQGARSFYYPPVAKEKCVDCHMNFIASEEFGAKDFDGKPGREVHNHLFLGANTGLAAIRGEKSVAEIHAKFLQDAKVRVDLFALREEGNVDGAFLGPLRPESPTLKPGKPYLVEVVVRTLGLGHPFSQGTVDSNEIWVELIASAEGRVIGRSGGIGGDGAVDPYAHFINVYMLDREGNRIDRRNPQDIFVPLYNKQIPPGAGQVVHFGLDVPKDLKTPITLEAKVNYRKFDRKYLDHIFGKSQGPELPVTTMASDLVKLAVEGSERVENPPSPVKDAWQRWNDYGIGLLLEGSEKGSQKGELRQAEQAFKQVAELGLSDGWTNLARVYIREGRIPDALAALDKASKHPTPSAPWIVAWLSAQIDERNGYLDEAVAKYESVLATRIPDRGLDFRNDFEVINAMAIASYARSRLEDPGSPERLERLKKAEAAYRRTLAIDSENVAAHYGLGLIYAEFAETVKDVSNLPRPESDQLKISAEEWDARLLGLTADGASSESRTVQARSLAKTVANLTISPRPEFGSKLTPLLAIVEKVAPLLDKEEDPLAKSALAGLLATTHKALHAMYKPDETAEGRAIGIARRNDKAADQNAQSIVIHPMRRPGAPGIDQPLETAALRETSR